MTPAGASFTTFVEAIQGLTFEAEVPVHRTLPQGFWSVSFHHHPRRGPEHLFTLAWGFPPRPEVQNLACGLVAEDSRILCSAYRTDRRGQFRVLGLPRDRYRAHYVTAIREKIDIDIWNRLYTHSQDAQAGEDLRRLEHDTKLPSDLCLGIRRVLNPPQASDIAAGRPAPLEQLPEVELALLAALDNPATRSLALAVINADLGSPRLRTAIEQLAREVDPALQDAAQAALQRLSYL
jgi:hypothetical protein